MKRRTSEQNGFINFPVTSKEYEDTGEGGLVVLLYVLEDKNFDKRWALSFNDEPFWDASVMRFTEESCATMVHQGEKEENKIKVSDMDRPILLCMNLASTGWSGWHKKKGRMFSASFDDLTEEGKQLLSLIKKLYPENRIVLTTTLDT